MTIIRLVTLITILAAGSTALAQEAWRAVFITEPGSRIDFMASANEFVESEDQASSYRFEFNVPSEGSTATIRLLPVGENTSPSEDYGAIVLARSDDMVVLLMGTAGLTRGDKFETYTLYPKLGIGFLTETSSFLGVVAMKAAATTNPRIPAATAKAFPLRRIDK
jgi:hypothetical protein